MNGRLFQNGLIHIYYGDGQGKTCAAVGLAVRACGCGGKVLYGQFLKNGRSGELVALKKMDGVDVQDCVPCGKFIIEMDEAEKAKAAAEQRAAFQRIARLALSGGYDLLVMDEVIGAVCLGMIGQEELMDFLRSRPAYLEVALTGHKMLSELAELADYISEIKKVKHPYDRGVRARRGAEV